MAVELGFFNPKTEATDFRPSLDPVPFLDKIKADNPAQFSGESRCKGVKNGRNSQELRLN